MKILAILTIFIISSTFVFGELPIGEVPPTIVLEADLGGRLDGTPWNSEELVTEKSLSFFMLILMSRISTIMSAMLSRLKIFL